MGIITFHRAVEKIKQIVYYKSLILNKDSIKFVVTVIIIWNRMVGSLERPRSRNILPDVICRHESDGVIFEVVSLFNYWLEVPYQKSVLQIFSLNLCVNFALLMVFIEKYKVLFLMIPSLFFSFVVHAFCVICKKPLSCQIYWWFASVLSNFL